MKYFLVFFLSTFIISVNCQIVATTEDGRKVKLNPDGTWKFLTEETANVNDTLADCSTFIKEVVDKVTGNTTLQSDVLIVSDEAETNAIGISIFIPKPLSIILLITAKGAGRCIDEGSKINILFTDGTRMELLTNGKFNCEEQAVVYFGDVFGKIDKLDILQTKKIEILRVWTSNGYVEVELTNNEAEKLMQTFSCATK